jgi:putative copper resistance protein D
MTELAAVVRFVHLAAVILLFGSFGFVTFIARTAFQVAGDFDVGSRSFKSSQSIIARWCLLVVFLSAVAALWIQNVNISETPNGASDFAALASLITTTQYGRVWLARMIVVLLLAVLLFVRARARNPSAKVDAVSAILTAVLLCTIAFAGHASAADGSAFIFQVSVDALHLLATGLWLGGLMPLLMLLRQCRRSSDVTSQRIASLAARRFSNLALGSVSLLIASGLYNAWNLVGGFAPLFGTAYGKWLLFKLGLLLPLLLLGAINRSRLRREAIGATPHTLERNVLVEIVLGLAILLIVGFMGVTPPARHVQPTWPFSFRWDWSILTKAPKARAEFDRALTWGAVGVVAIATAIVRRRRRFIAMTLGAAALGCALYTADAMVSIDAYPATYKRPLVAYQAISVANGGTLYQDSGCADCHGPGGYGNGPAADSLQPKPVDLTAPHANLHTAGDLYWWLSYGVKPSSSMPGFGQSLSEEERWDLINFIRALSSGERARNLAPVIEAEPWLVAPDFTYGINSGETRTLKDYRGERIVLLVLLNVADTEERLQQLGAARARLDSAGVETIVVPNPIDLLFVSDKLPGLIVNEGIREVAETYRLFARSFNDENPLAATPHVEYLIDRQGYIRARWLPAENDGWRNLDRLFSQIELLRKETSRAPAPDDHVH